MKNIDVDDLVTCIEESFLDNGVVFDVYSLTQNEVKEEISLESGFNMLSNEKTKDNEFDVDIDESKFLNDTFYEENWVKVSYGNAIAFVCVNVSNNNLNISAIEVNEDCRGYRFGRMIVEGIENYAINEGFETIVLSAFDSDSNSFWEHMGYNNSDCGVMYKNI